MPRGLAWLAPVVIIASTLAACGRGAYNVPSDIRALAETSLVFDPVWLVEREGPEYFGGAAFERGGLAVSEEAGLLVATTSDGFVTAFDVVTGEQMWTVESTGEPFAAPPAIHRETVVICVPDGTVRALHLASGGEQWRRDLGEVFHSAAAVTDGAVYVNTATGRVHALSRADGRTLWSVDRRGVGDLRIAGGGQVVEADGIAYTGFPDGSLAAIDGAGELLWLTTLANGETRLVDVDTTPLIVGDAIYAGSFSGGFYRLERATGSVVWRADLRGATSPVWNGTHVVTSTSDGEVVWLDPDSGTTRYSIDLETDSAGDLTPWGERLLLVDPTRGLVALDASRPWTHARFRLETGLTASPAAAGNRVYVLSNGGSVVALDTHWLEASEAYEAP